MELELCAVHMRRFVDFYLEQAEAAAQHIIAVEGGGVPDEVDVSLATFRTFLRQLRDAGHSEMAFHYIAVFTAQAHFARRDEVDLLTRMMALLPGIGDFIRDFQADEAQITESN